MNKLTRETTCAIAAIALTAACRGYEVDTHAAVSLSAFDQSIAAQTELAQRLGLERLDPNFPFRISASVIYSQDRDGYFDSTASEWANTLPFSLMTRRAPQLYEQAQLPGIYRLTADPAGALAFRTRAWFMRGAIREDDLRFQDYEDDETPPDADPYGEIVRVYHHFYDPAHDKALNFPGFTCQESFGGIPGGCRRSTDWAMGETNAASSDAGMPPTVDSMRRQHFGWADAREAFMCALTYNRAVDRSQNLADRRLCYTTTFKALGHVAHLLQDMAQPQHTRNDQHNPPDGLVQPPFATDENRRTFEVWTNFRATGGQEISGNEVGQFRSIFGASPALPIRTTGYPVPQFSKPVKFFSTRQIEMTSDTMPDAAVLLQRRGMADFSNRNFFSEGTILKAAHVLPPADAMAPGYTWVRFNSRTVMGGGTVFERELRRAVSDQTNGSYVDDLAASGGLLPLARQGMWTQWGLQVSLGNSIAIEQYSVHADVLLPRATAYTAGLINHFFRGQLEVTPPADRVVGVLNQGELHVVDFEGYPRRTSNGAIFGFEKLRLKLRNTTPAIVESGTGESFPQLIGDPDGAGPIKGELVAVARYHRNSCYKPDLTGERVQSFAPPPQLVIAEPTCAAGLTTRTGYEEISVSTPLTISASGADGASELDNLAVGAGIEKIFDFSADPIPVNATDLIIQVVYRGRMGRGSGAGGSTGNFESDAIAVGMLDVREPTFAAFWNNTDRFWNQADWLVSTPTYPQKSARDFWVCAGAPPVKLVFRFDGGVGNVAMVEPAITGGQPRAVRLGLIFPAPEFPLHRFNVRGTSVPLSPPSMPVRTIARAGRISQANRDEITAATQAMPSVNCNDALPTAPEYWCADPVQRRRGQVMGEPAQPIYFDTGGQVTPRDVDSPAPLPAFGDLIALGAGTVRFNTDATLQPCPNPPTFATDAMVRLQQELLELDETARHLGLPELER